ncbi:hypothetical protein PQR46_18565 [Paraburkholderia sediminicola]|uniref:hypothetical protein n=1 Tax=Paraburkholderia sediminicola TaxID=458836 RepID=UPI0038BD1F88
MTKLTEKSRVIAIAWMAMFMLSTPAAEAQKAPSPSSAPVAPLRQRSSTATIAQIDGAPDRIADSLQKIAAAELAASNARATTGLSVDKLYPMIVSTLAFLLSGGLGIYTYRKDAKARRQSISDDYWLRKVVSPVAIEPVVKFILETVASLPEDCSHSAFSVPSIDQFLKTYQNNHLAQATNLIALGLLSADLYSKASAAFDDIEDAVISFCSDNRQALKDASGNAKHTRTHASEAVRHKLNEMLQDVRNYQMGVK